MISLLLPALAVQPADLVAALPEARAQLAVCRETGCPRPQGARASWLLAVGTYVETGFADGQLAADVRVLDPELFETLPEVLQARADLPSPWTLRVDPSTLEALPVQAAVPVVAPLPPAPPQVGRPAVLEVSVRGSDGALIPGAFVRLLREDEQHRVNVDDGVWSGSALYTANEELALLRGEVVDVEVGAPGHGLERRSVLLRRKTRVAFELAPVTRPTSEHPMGQAALAAYERWEEARRAEPLGDHDRLARVATETLRDWLAAQPDPAVEELCLTVGSYRACQVQPRPPEGSAVNPRLQAVVDAFDGCPRSFGYVTVPVRVDEGTIEVVGSPRGAGWEVSRDLEHCVASGLEGLPVEDVAQHREVGVTLRR